MTTPPCFFTGTCAVFACGLPVVRLCPPVSACPCVRVSCLPRVRLSACPPARLWSACRACSPFARLPRDRLSHKHTHPLMMEEVGPRPRGGSFLKLGTGNSSFSDDIDMAFYANDVNLTVIGGDDGNSGKSSFENHDGVPSETTSSSKSSRNSSPTGVDDDLLLGIRPSTPVKALQKPAGDDGVSEFQFQGDVGAEVEASSLLKDFQKEFPVSPESSFQGPNGLFSSPLQSPSKSFGIFYSPFHSPKISSSPFTVQRSLLVHYKAQMVRR